MRRFCSSVRPHGVLNPSTCLLARRYLQYWLRLRLDNLIPSLALFALAMLPSLTAHA